MGKLLAAGNGSGEKSENSLTHSFIHLLASISQTPLCVEHRSGHYRYPGDRDTPSQ